jgi:chromosome segregation ATPase
VNQYLGALKEKFSPLANEIQQLNVQLSTKEQELQSAAALTRRQNVQLVSKDQELQAANAMIQSHRERLTHLVTSLNTRSEERNAAESRAEVLKAAKEIADATIGQLNLKIERLLEENFTLSETLQEAERDLSEQRRIFSRQEERLKSYNGGVKRPWSGLDRGDGSSLAGSVKKPRHGSMSLPDGPIDLTEDA